MQPDRLWVGQVVTHVWLHTHELEGAYVLQFPGLRTGWGVLLLPPSEDNVHDEDGGTKRVRGQRRVPETLW